MLRYNSKDPVKLYKNYTLSDKTKSDKIISRTKFLSFQKILRTFVRLIILSNLKFEMRLDFTFTGFSLYFFKIDS